MALELIFLGAFLLQLVSTVAWQCPDPGCAAANTAGTDACSRCGLSFANAQEYLINKGANTAHGSPKVWHPCAMNIVRSTSSMASVFNG